MEMEATGQPGRLTAKERYEALRGDRQPFLDRGRSAAKLTIPTLLPDEGANGSTVFFQAYQSLGARAVNNLAAKVLLALFPPATSYFRLAVEPEAEAALAQMTEDAKGEIESALRKVEDQILGRIEGSGARRTFSELLKHLVVVGNVLLDRRKKQYRLHPLTSYVVKRDGEGNPFEVVVVETLDRKTLPQDVVAMLTERPTSPQDRERDKPVEVYTRAVLAGSMWRVWQEVENKVVESTRGQYPKDACPLIPLRWTKVDGQDYGRSQVEDYAGDLRTLETQTKAVAELTAALAKILVFVDENGVTSIDQIQRAENLSVLPGNARDITVLQLEKQADLRAATEQIERLERRISAAFLLTSSVQRDAERVTAEEIRLLAGELEQTLGGNYAVMAEELQRPLVQLELNELKRAGKVRLPDKYVITRIVTGLEALGRNSDLEKLRVAAATINELFGPTASATYLNPTTGIKRVFTALGIEADGIVRSEDEVRAQQAQGIATELATRAAPAMMGSGTGQPPV